MRTSAHPPDWLRQEVEAFLTEQETNYSAELSLLGRRWVSPGYHSSIPTGQWVHSTRESLAYAACLVWRADPADLERAARTIDAVIDLQERRMTDPAYGIWPWMHEEPLARMSPPDWNWADFCGNLLLTIHCIADRSGGASSAAAAELPGDLVARMLAAVEAASLAVFRRNVTPGYTNIAIMGAVLTTVAGEVLGQQWLLDYGRERLERVVEHTRLHGDFNEYNSPTYTVVALEEAERALYLSRDPRVRAAAEALRLHAWTVIADHFHPGTDQWAGPHSRTYSDFIKPNVARRLSRSVGRTLRIADQPAEERSILDDVPNLVPELPCPDDLLDRFEPEVTRPRRVQNRFWVGDDGRARTGYTWVERDLSLGSVSDDSMWTQRRGLIAYWRGAERPAVFRVRALKDGRDFASMMIRVVQHERMALVAVTPAGGFGDYHLSLDRSPDGCYDAGRLAVRFSVAGAGAEVSRVRGGWLLASGRHGVFVQPVEAVCRAEPLDWVGAAIGDDCAAVDVTIARSVRFCPSDEADTRVVFVARLVDLDGSEPNTPSLSDCRCTRGDDSVTWTSGDLTLTIPRR